MQAWLVPYSQVKSKAKQSALGPRVHRGFYASWHRNSFNQRVIAHVRQLLDGRKTADLADMRVIITGGRPRPF
jgi:hypothetical protein